ncbi:3-oxosteroid 1-dehydrogenase KstD [Cupriavidus necator N-1]|uniref:3-oxosteroid 1-dehydrogenase n=1 Tax=Cupriavidus necator (strain ATCC 43291 / DSM 13513 / CCUG 52238 / LMG 8453 / N-1) TaxID=1042878 RepID=F8GRA5_CUPNN|nr:MULTISPECIES: FAD-dependent oxidoreductase [Cupriavidus]AEI79565.1 3-oxosteroid 1-dehydrogenase KstD [Cupriavidus necator N-1]KAI3601946.1 3-oxosteroid 1-dehydrogenase [Cupriavidus necator H850]MDX6010802.1 FAD-dependent oxidoreductase [Cupriavidus necator]QUN26530.1 FAD-dependent oxidoreductase [Cupriavidus sp. KK10]
MSQSRARMQPSEFDVVVVGSGAGGMLAACRAADRGLSVVVLEKSSQYGGTSAVSGGGIWIPLNHHIAPAGGRDDYATALEYILACAGEHGDPQRVRAYLEQAPRMLQYLEQQAGVRYYTLPRYADYFQKVPGAMPGYRALDPMPFDGAQLREEFSRLRPPSPGTLVGGRVAVTSAEAHALLCRAPGWLGLAARQFSRYWLDLGWRRKTRRDRRLTLGNSLVGGLRRAMMDRAIPLWLDTALQDLIVEDGTVRGVRAVQDGRVVEIRALRGVILAAGGFERNQAMREQYLPQPTQAAWSATPPNNTGDGIRAAQAAGAGVALMSHVWGAPTVHVQGEEKQRALFIERAMPGCLVVNGQGRRFVNEAAPYSEFVPAMYRDHEKTGSSVPAWMVFDATFRHKYPCGPILPGSVMPDRSIPASLSGILVRADSLAQLAQRIGVDAGGLADSVARMNRYAATGVDEEFGKGDNLFDTYYSDPAVQPNPCLAPIGKAPFYAVRLDAGDIGTKGGLVTDASARVLRDDGTAIAGLFAIGNTSASMMGTSYPGAGSTLGPAMTFGFIAADVLSQNARQPAAAPHAQTVQEAL